eukprot:SAG25_NODE_965_length_4521_cov_44.574401_5_plen_76_part_00
MEVRNRFPKTASGPESSFSLTRQAQTNHYDRRTIRAAPAASLAAPRRRVLAPERAAAAPRSAVAEFERSSAGPYI